MNNGGIPRGTTGEFPKQILKKSHEHFIGKNFRHILAEFVLKFLDNFWISGEKRKCLSERIPDDIS